MNNKTKILLGVLVIILIVLAGLGGYFLKQFMTEECKTCEKCEECNETTEVSQENKIIYVNEYMSVTFPESWEYSETQEEGGIKITKDNYVLYINLNSEQTSGVEGGRFSEITDYMPGALLVIKTHPSDICGADETSEIGNLTRVDLYIDSFSLEYNYNCNVPTDDKAVWYGSYVTTASKGYFGYVDEMDGGTLSFDPKQFVITMSYDVQDVDNLPEKNDSELGDKLDEMSEIVESIQVK